MGQCLNCPALTGRGIALFDCCLYKDRGHDKAMERPPGGILARLNRHSRRRRAKLRRRVAGL